MVKTGPLRKGVKRKTMRKQPSFGLCERDRMVLRFVSRRWRVAHVCKTFVWVMCVRCGQATTTQNDHDPLSPPFLEGRNLELGGGLGGTLSNWRWPFCKGSSGTPGKPGYLFFLTSCAAVRCTDKAMIRV